MRVHVPRSAAAPLTESPCYARTGVRLYVRPTVQTTVHAKHIETRAGPAQVGLPDTPDPFSMKSSIFSKSLWRA